MIVYLSDELLADLRLLFFPDQMPTSFQVFQLPPKIMPFVIATLEASLAPPRGLQKLVQSAVVTRLVSTLASRVELGVDLLIDQIAPMHKTFLVSTFVSSFRVG